MYNLVYIIWIALILTISPWNLSQWTAHAEQCSSVELDVLIMECQSTGLVSNQRYSGAIHVSVEVQAEPMGTVQNYWAGLALNSDIIADDQYAQIALMQGIEPFNSTNTPSAVVLSTTGKEDCCQVVRGIDQKLWHTLSIDYAKNSALYTIDGISKSVHVNLGNAYQIELLCVAVNPGTSVPGALTKCKWRNLQITSK